MRDEKCNSARGALKVTVFFPYRIILKKVTFNVAVLVTVFKSDEKSNDKCNDTI